MATLDELASSADKLDDDSVEEEFSKLDDAELSALDELSLELLELSELAA